MHDRLFVYGTLRGKFDNPHARQLRAAADSLGPATVRGSLFQAGEYPGFRREPDGVVHGELWKLRDAEPTLAALDEYEGPEYSRIVIALERPPGTAWIYLYVGKTR